MTAPASIQRFYFYMILTGEIAMAEKKSKTEVEIIRELFKLVNDIDCRRHQELELMLKGSDILKAEINERLRNSGNVIGMRSVAAQDLDLPEALVRQSR